MLLQHASLPADFTTWEDCVTVDEDSFDSFRYNIRALRPDT